VLDAWEEAFEQPFLSSFGVSLELVGLAQVRLQSLAPALARREPLRLNCRPALPSACADLRGAVGYVHTEPAASRCGGLVLLACWPPLTESLQTIDFLPWCVKFVWAIPSDSYSFLGA
jgi:hypothetical protein